MMRELTLAMDVYMALINSTKEACHGDVEAAELCRDTEEVSVRMATPKIQNGAVNTLKPSLIVSVVVRCCFPQPTYRLSRILACLLLKLVPQYTLTRTII